MRILCSTLAFRRATQISKAQMRAAASHADESPANQALKNDLTRRMYSDQITPIGIPSQMTDDPQRSCIHVEPTGPAPEATSSGGAPSGTVGNRYEGARRGAFPRRGATEGSGTTAEMRNDGAPSCGFPEGTDGVPRWPATHQGPGGRPRGRRRGPCAPARRATQIT